jgi:hypothetical protein
LINDLIAPIDHTMADTEIGTAPGITTLPHLRSLSIIGPHKVTGVSDTSSRRRVFTCRPLSQADEAICAADIIRRLSTQAFRRPVSEKDHARLMTFYARGRKDRNFEFGVTKALEAILASPQFLVRVEESKLTNAGYRLGDYELASRLSFFIWGRGPDAALLKAAGAGQLSLPGAMSKQAKRMIAAPNADALATRFASQWLRLQDLEKVIPDPILYPYSDQTLSLALKKETELFFNSLVKEDRSVLELLTADYTFVNERVALLYGINDVKGDTFRRVKLEDSARWGLLGKGAVLMAAAYPNRTSPVLRGAFILRDILGTPPAAPPKNVPVLKEEPTTGNAHFTTVRDRMAAHRASPVCFSCHGTLDPLGFALENFDAVGTWRDIDRYAGTPIDASGSMADGTALAGPDDLRKALMKHPDQFVQTFTERLLTYALSRTLQYYDMPVVRKIVRDTKADDYRFSSIVWAIVQSEPFQMREIPAAAPNGTTPVREVTAQADTGA